VNSRNKTSGFTLVEVITASILSCITLTCIVQFFLTQLRQYKLISNYNQSNENLRISSKFLEKDVHNSLEFYVFDDLEEALKFNFQDKETLKSNKSGNCVLFIQERGIVDGGRGTIYFLGPRTINSISNEANTYYYCPFYRAMVSFKNAKIEQTKNNLSKLKLTNLLASNNTEDRVFYISPRRQFSNKEYMPGCRHGLYINFTLAFPGMMKPSLSTNFCFFSRNPRFYLPE